LSKKAVGEEEFLWSVQEIRRVLEMIEVAKGM